MKTFDNSSVYSGNLSSPVAIPLLWIQLIVFSSGFAGLGYEIVWTRMLAVALGHEIIAVLAVLGAFFSGLALGAFALSETIRQSSHPHRWYALLEIIIALWALSLTWLIPIFNGLIPQWTGEQPSQLVHWSIAFGATLLLLLPGTAAMGATLPALERVYSKLFGPGKYVGRVYAANTFGAVAGTIVSTFILVPELGYTQTMWACAAVNICCAAGIILLLKKPTTVKVNNLTAVAGQTVTNFRLLTALFISGLLGLSYEVLVIRILSQVLEDTIYSFALVLSIYLLGTACGAAIYQRWFIKRPAMKTFSLLLILTSCATLSGLSVLWLADASYEWLSQLLARTTANAMIAEVTLAMMVFFLPTIAMGMLFSHLAQLASAPLGLGYAMAVNTLGAAIGPLIAGILLLPAIGAKFALLLVSLGYLTLLMDLRWQTLCFATLPVVAGIFLAWMPPLRFISIPPGGSLLEYHTGIMASVAVVDDASGIRYLKVNNHFTMGSTSSVYADHRQTHIPLLLHASPSKALFLGVGTGMSLNAAQHHPQLEVTAVELVPEVLTVLDYFGTDPDQNNWQNTPRLLSTDARRLVISSDNQFDVIIADLFHPSRDGAGSLYTREHFEAVKQRLASGGLFCQWLPLFQMDLETFKLISRTFIDRFPHVQVYIPHFSLRHPIVGLIGSTQPLRYDSGWLQNNVHSRRLQQQLVGLRLNSDLALFGGFITDDTMLRKFVGDGELNTDNRPLVTYRAPDFAYRQQQAHDQRLITLVEALTQSSATLLTQPLTPQQTAFDYRLRAYWQARDAYLKAGLGIVPTGDIQAMLGKIREPLLDVVRISNDFMSAYLPLLTMAQALHESDPQAAYQLLTELKQAAPARPESRQLLQELYNN